jgi:hypothetical protein
MKTLQRFILGTFLCVLCAWTASAAVTFTISPSTISNTYAGPVTLQITNIPTGDTVVVQKYLDLASNGVIDGNDLLVQQFTLTDGQATTFTNGALTITNMLVPGDLNPSTGAITAQLTFEPINPGGSFVQSFLGQYLFKLSSPAGHFAAITNSFVVTNFPFGQSFSGVVRSNTLAVSNAVVLLFSPNSSGSNPQYGTVANGSGNYSIQAPPGTYLLAAYKTNYLANLSTEPTVTLTSGESVVTNISLTNATESFSGKVVDVNNSSLGLPGALLPFTSANNFLTIVFSDTNGNFSLAVNTNQWKVNSDSGSLDTHGYLELSNNYKVNTATGAVSGLTLSVPKAAAMIYGTVKNNLGQPIPGVQIYSSDTVGQYEDDPKTDQNGNYYAGALAESWQISLSGDDIALSNYVASGSSQFALSTGQATQVNFTLIPATNVITGTVKDNNNNPIVGVGVTASATISGSTYQTISTEDTDNSGNYVLFVPNGTWSVNVNCNGGEDSLNSLGSYACPNSQTATISGNNSTNNFVVLPCGIVSITTTSLPPAEVNVYYNQNLQATSCNPSFTWLQASGITPPGVNLNSSGAVSGTPTGSGVYTFTAQVTDGNGAHTNEQLTLAVSNALQITTTTLPNGTNGSSYNQQLQAIGGVPFAGVPYSWSLVSASLPPTLNLATNGLLSGSLTSGGQYNFTVQAQDSAGAAYNQSLALNVINTNIPTLSVGTASGQIIVLWPASAGTNYTLEMTTNLSTGPWVPATNGVPQNAYLFTNSSPAVFFRLQ